MSIKVEVQYDHVPQDNGLVAGWWLAITKDNEQGHSEKVSFLSTKPTARQIRKLKKELKLEHAVVVSDDAGDSSNQEQDTLCGVASL